MKKTKPKTKTRKRTPKKKKQLISFEKFLVFQKIFFVVFSVVLIANIFVMILLKYQQTIGSLKQTTSSFAYGKVLQRQVGHFSEAQSVIDEIQNNFWAIEEYIVLMEKGEILTEDDKSNLAVELKLAEDGLARLGISVQKYFNDQIVQYHPRANGNITNYFQQANLLVSSGERFVRSAEIVVLFGDQKESEEVLVLDNFYDTLVQIDNLEELSKDLKILR